MGPVPQGASAGWALTAPPGTAITAATLKRDLFKRGDARWTLFISDQTGAVVPGQDCAIEIGLTVQCEVAGTLELPGLNDTTLVIGARCDGAACVSGGTTHNVRADLDHAVVTISDPTPPAAPTASGPLTQPAWHAGTVAVDLASSDAVGISRFQVTGPNGAVVASVSQTCDYTYTVPCPTSPSVRLQIDTTRLPDGVVPVTISAADAAQNTTSATIQVMIANNPPAAPTVTGLPAGPTSQPSLPITARVSQTGVPITAVDWMLCASTCGPATAVGVTDATASFTVAPPADGSYTLKTYAVDAAGHSSAITSQALAVDRSEASPLPTRPNSTVTVPAAIGRGGVKLRLSLRRRSAHRFELAVTAEPRRSGTVHVGLTFAGHRPGAHTLDLRRGVAVLSATIPRGATRLTISVTGLGAHATRHVRLA